VNRDCQQEVGDRALPSLLKVLQNDAEIDADIAEALETITQLCHGDPDDASKDLALRHTTSSEMNREFTSCSPFLAIPNSAPVMRLYSAFDATAESPFSSSNLFPSWPCNCKECYFPSDRSSLCSTCFDELLPCFDPYFTYISIKHVSPVSHPVYISSELTPIHSPLTIIIPLGTCSAQVLAAHSVVDLDNAGFSFPHPSPLASTRGAGSMLRVACTSTTLSVNTGLE
jgi:hypothetical protein